MGRVSTGRESVDRPPLPQRWLSGVALGAARPSERTTSFGVRRAWSNCITASFGATGPAATVLCYSYRPPSPYGRRSALAFRLQRISLTPSVKASACLPSEEIEGFHFTQQHCARSRNSGQPPAPAAFKVIQRWWPDARAASPRFTAAILPLRTTHRCCRTRSALHLVPMFARSHSAHRAFVVRSAIDHAAADPLSPM